MRKWWVRFFEKRICKKTTLVVQPIMFEGAPTPMVRLFTEHQCDGAVMADVLVPPDKVEDLIAMLIQAHHIARDPANFSKLFK